MPNAWVELQRELPFEGTPVLSDSEFERAAEEIRAITSEAGQAGPRSRRRSGPAARRQARRPRGDAV